MQLPILRPAIALPLLLALVASLLVGLRADAQAGSDTVLDVLVSEDPVNWTPNITGDRVVAIDTASGVVAAGGLFTEAKKPGGTNQPFGNFLLFEEGTGDLLPSPSFDKEVMAVEAAADGQSFYVGGRFNNVNGQKRSGLARIALDGTVISSWNVQTDWAVYDLALVGDTLYVGGNFNKIKGNAQKGLAAVDANTGALKPWAPVISGVRSTTRTNGSLSIDKLDVTPDGSRLVVIGNFSKVDGTTRDQVAMFDIAGPNITLADWYANGFAAYCRASKWPMYIRDMDISPDGDHVVFGTTGAYGSPTGSQALCDTVSRFELTSTGTVQPTWRSYTGGDTTYGVAATGDVVYAGGHMRWMNNPYCGDRECAGAVERTGITALDARTGVPLDWDPQRNPRGYGTYELIAGDDGLWVGQDTGNIGGEFHSLIAMLPTAGGRAVARPAAGAPAAGVLLLDTDQTADLVGSGGGGLLGGTVEVSFDPRDVVGATTIGNQVMTAGDDGVLRLVADGGTGASTTVDLNGLAPNYFRVAEVTSLFYDERTSEIFYTRSGSTTLRGRGYSSDSRVVEALEHSVSTSGDGFDWHDATGAYIDGTTLYIGRHDGTLDAIDWIDGAPVRGTMRTVGGPALDGVDYDVSSLTAVGTDAPAANQAPVAALEVTCDGRECALDAGDSYDPDGSLSAIEHTVDGEVVATGALATITVPSEGTHTFAVTVVDDDGATASTEQVVDVVADPIAVIAASCDAFACTFDGSASTDGTAAGEDITAWAWDLGDGTTADTATVEHTYAEAGDVTVTLTVTDGEGATGTTTQVVTPRTPLEGVTVLGITGDNRWTATPTTTVPAEVRDGSVALLELSVNASGDVTPPPTGPGDWVELDRVVTNNTETIVWLGQLDAADAGAEVTVPLARGRKIDITLVALGGVDVTDPVVAHAAVGETVDQAAHTTPTLEVDRPVFVVNLWTDKTGGSTAWTPAPGQTPRHEAHGSGGGRIGVLFTDADGLTGPGTVGGHTATSEVADDAATMWTIALRPV